MRLGRGQGLGQVEQRACVPLRHERPAPRVDALRNGRGGCRLEGAEGRVRAITGLTSLVDAAQISGTSFLPTSASICAISLFASAIRLVFLRSRKKS